MNNSTIKVKTGECAICANGKSVPLIKNLCQSHYWQSRRKDSPKEVKIQQKPIRKVSHKRAKQVAIYLKVRLEKLNEQPDCEVCGHPAIEIHHKKGKIEELLYDKSNLLSVCRLCHQRIELNPEWAIKNGYSVERL